MKVISLLNQKGGVGKTSTCHHLAGAFSRLGLRTLLVDNDPQASLTQGLFGPDMTRAMPPSETIADLYRGDAGFPEALIMPTHVPGVHLLPGSKATADWNYPRPKEAAINRQLCLREFLEEVRPSGRFDVALIDCPPNLALCSWAALLASDGLVVPLMPEDYASQGIADVLESLEAAQAVELKPTPELVGLLLTRVEPRKTIHKFLEERIRNTYEARVFEQRVPAGAAFAEAISHRMPVEQYRPKSAAAVATRLVALEFLKRAGIARPGTLDPEPAELEVA
jgi:chromosome partitioning protein